MRLLLVASLTLAAFGQQIRINPFTGLPDLTGTGSGGTVTAGTGILVTAGPTVSGDSATLQFRATQQAGTTNYGRSTTGNDTYVVSLTPSLTAYTRGGCVVLDADTANTGAATINVDTLGAKSILTRSGAALSTGDITANKPITICYDGTQYIIQGDGGGASVAVPYLLSGGVYYQPDANMATAYLPSLLSFTWANQGTSTVAGSTYEVMTNASGSSGLHNRHAALSTNTTVEGWFSWTKADRADGAICGLTLYETGTNKVYTIAAYGDTGTTRSFSAYYTASGATFTANNYTNDFPFSFGKYGYRIVITGGNLVAYISNGLPDGSGGVQWMTLGTTAVTTAFTTAPDRFGYGSLSPGSGSNYCMVTSLRAF